MSFVISKKDLFDLIQKAYPIAPVKTSLQILSNLKISCLNNVLEVVANDLDHSIKVFSSVKESETFDIAVNARRIFDIVREMPEGNINGEIDENVLCLQSEKGFSCKIAGADVRDFPVIPEIKEEKSISIPIRDFKRMVLKSSFAVSKDTSRSCLCGVLIDIEKNKITMVATDGHRLGCSSAPGAFQTKEKVSVIVSPKSLNHLIKITEEEKESKNISLTIGEKYVFFKTDQFSLCSKLIDGPYPDYEKVIPKSNPKQVIVEKAYIIDALKRVSILSNQKTHLVKYVFSRDSLELVVLNRDIGGEAKELIPVSYEGEEHIIGFNAQYYSEILGIIETKKVRLEMNTQISACLLFPVYEKDDKNKNDEIFLIMPLRIMEE